MSGPEAIFWLFSRHRQPDLRLNRTYIVADIFIESDFPQLKRKPEILNPNTL
jgi:hypothetical protein